MPPVKVDVAVEVALIRSKRPRVALTYVRPSSPKAPSPPENVDEAVVVPMNEPEVKTAAPRWYAAEVVEKVMSRAVV